MDANLLSSRKHITLRVWIELVPIRYAGHKSPQGSNVPIHSFLMLTLCACVRDGVSAAAKRTNALNWQLPWRLNG